MRVDGSDYPLSPTDADGDMDRFDSKKNTMRESCAVVESGGKHFTKVEPSRIDQENVASTMDDVISTLANAFHMDKADFVPIGSTGKKLPGGTSGDIDLAIDQTKL